MSGSMAGRVALVTGAASGIGRATAEAFAREGAAVLLADVTEDAGEKAAGRLREGGAQALFVPCDVSLPEEVARMVSRAVQAFGRLDYAFNNAGIEGETASAADCTPENWDRVIAVNLTGVWLCMREEIPRMLAQGGGSIVNCASVAGLVGFRGLPAYAASKHGLVGLTRTAALEYATRGIRVNAVCPGVVRTPMVDRFTGGDPAREAQVLTFEPVGRMGLPEEIAAGVVWLCSDAASFVTGHAMAMDGGFVAQ